MQQRAPEGSRGNRRTSQDGKAPAPLPGRFSHLCGELHLGSSFIVEGLFIPNSGSFQGLLVPAMSSRAIPPASGQYLLGVSRQFPGLCGAEPEAEAVAGSHIIAQSGSCCQDVRDKVSGENGQEGGPGVARASPLPWLWALSLPQPPPWLPGYSILRPKKQPPAGLDKAHSEDRCPLCWADTPHWAPV